MKSLQESLFDKDIVEKGVSIDFETLRDMLFNFGRKKAKLFDKTGVIFFEGRQAIFIKRFLGEDGGICFELELSVTNMYPEGAAFNVPVMVVHDRWNVNHLRNSWKSSRTDVNATRRKIDSTIKLENNDKFTSTIEATDNNISKVFDLYNSIIEKFCSTKFEKELKKYIDQYSENKAIPGLILDILMKKLIAKG